MSLLTAQGRQKIRDQRLATIGRRLRQDARLANLPAHQRDTLSELKLVGKDLYADIRQRGIILPDGSINPSGAEHRQNAGAQLRFVLAVTELNRQSSADPVVDLVQLMSAQGEQGESVSIANDTDSAAPVEPVAEPEDEAK